MSGEHLAGKRPLSEPTTYTSGPAAHPCRQPWWLGLLALSLVHPALAGPAAQAGDPRLVERVYDPAAVVTVPVQRGSVTLVELAPDESISEVAVGQGGDCSKPEAVWCVAAQPGGRHLFVKAKSGASAPNHLAVVTDRRSHTLRFEVLPEGDRRPAVLRLTLKPPTPPRATARADAHTQAALAALAALPPLPMPPSEKQQLAARLQARAPVMNPNYTLAEGAASQDIVPSLVYDDGRFTYLRFAGNREVPAVFHVQGDGSEALVNTRMEGELLVVDRVSRQLMLRAGSAVVALWNEAFDANGLPPSGGTTVPGVQRVLKGDALPDVAAPATDDAEGHTVEPGETPAGVMPEAHTANPAEGAPGDPQ